jgi:hypothetical protein
MTGLCGRVRAWRPGLISRARIPMIKLARTALVVAGFSGLEGR